MYYGLVAEHQLERVAHITIVPAAGAIVPDPKNRAINT
jgi:hypothetical protein